MSLPSFPPQAFKVLRIIREEAPRPKSLPVVVSECTPILAWTIRSEQRCPMGLVPGSSVAPTQCGYFANGRCTQVAVEAFWRWWDSIALIDAQAAMDFIWNNE